MFNVRTSPCSLSALRLRLLLTASRAFFDSAIVKQTPLLLFESFAFKVIPGEDEETNPGIYGKALAQWLAGQLRAAGFRPGEVIAEDYGWCVPIESKPHWLFVVCANGEGPNQWQLFAFAEGGLIARLLGNDKRSRVFDFLVRRRPPLSRVLTGNSLPPRRRIMMAAVC